MHYTSRSPRRTRFAVVVGASLLVSCSDNPTPTTPTPEALTISCPAPVSAQSPSGQPIAVQYAAATAATGAPPAAISCDHASGAVFPLGSTTVTCTATDQIRRTNACTFAVTVTAAPNVNATRFLAFGDSITEGEIITEGDHFGFRALLIDYGRSYPTDLQNDLIGYYTVQAQSIFVTNEGSQGETTTSGAQRLPGRLAADQPQVLLLMEGSNDGLSSGMDASLTNIRAMVQAAKNGGVRVFLASIPPENPSADGSCVSGATDRGGNAPYVVPYNAGLQAIAAIERVTFVDVYQAFGPNPSGDLLDCDGLHPTAMGYRLIADTFFNSIKLNLSVQPTSSPLRMIPSVVPPRRK